MPRLTICLLATFGLAAAAVAQEIPNPEFRQGTAEPAGWQLSGGGRGRWVDREVLEVTGSGEDECAWRAEGMKLAPGGLYRFEFRARRLDGSGSIVAGPTFANRDYTEITREWQSFGHVFVVPEGTESATLRLGQWHATGTIQFDAVRIAPVVPVHRRAGELVLGDGESLRSGKYRFAGTFSHEGSNYHRTLAAATAGFNSDRWTLGGGQSVTYRFELPGHQFPAGRIAWNVNYHTAGSCTAEASRDGKSWKAIGTLENVGTREADVPAELFPAEAIYLRFKAAERASFQINRVEFAADAPGDAAGETAFAAVAVERLPLRLKTMTLDGAASGDVRLQYVLENAGTSPLTLTLAARSAEGVERTLAEEPATIGAGETAVRSVALPAAAPGQHTLTLSAAQAGQPAARFTATLPITVPDYYRADYGRRIAGIEGETAVWWCDATRKVPKGRPTPGESAPAAALSAARNDAEAVQVVVRPEKALRGLTAAASALAGPGGATIAAKQVEILQVYYHFVEHPTDATGLRDWWPDALPPLEKPIDVAAGENQPLWVLVHVPKGAAPGDYRGTVSLKAEGFAAEVPLALHVWDFTLPEKNHIDTAFGFSPGAAFQYHGVKSEEDRRKVLELYWKNFAAHRISPYDPAPLDPIRVKFDAKATPPRAEVDFSAFDRAFARAVDEYHFTNFRLPIQGMGGGTFHDREEPEIAGFGEDTPEYQAMFSSYVKQLEQHFRERKWLELPYIYWFDEPEPKDYDFVRKGFERLKQHAPGLRTMLTEEPVEALAGPIDIWCPITPNYDHAAAEKRRAEDERFWWYVCTGPKAPYATLFIDHPATELRVWLWQTWQRGIKGVLVWQSNYWTSSTAFPDGAQNPYEDPMGYVSGYSTPRGTKRFWGNGDGRFIYPPLAAAVPGKTLEAVLEPPVSGIRWEMLREGIEDYEYLHRLSELVAAQRRQLGAERVARYEALLAVPLEITRGMTALTTDPAPIYARRAEIAKAIEELAAREQKSR